MWYLGLRQTHLASTHVACVSGWHGLSASQYSVTSANSPTQTWSNIFDRSSGQMHVKLLQPNLFVIVEESNNLSATTQVETVIDSASDTKKNYARTLQHHCSKHHQHIFGHIDMIPVVWLCLSRRCTCPARYQALAPCQVDIYSGSHPHTRFHQSTIDLTYIWICKKIHV